MIHESFCVHPHSPFRLDLTVWALRRRAHNRIDYWNGTTYTRVLLIDQIPVAALISGCSTQTDLFERVGIDCSSDQEMIACLRRSQVRCSPDE